MSDAVERAALTQLRSPAKWAAGLALTLSVVGGLVAFKHGVSIFWGILIPPLVALASGAAALFGARRINRGLAQSVSIYNANGSLMHCARDGLAAILLTGATTFGLILGLHAYISHDWAPAATRDLVLLSCCTVALPHMLLARAAGVSALTAYQAQSPDQLPRHRGSLALLVSDSFLTPLSMLSLWMTVSALGYAALSLTPTVTEPEQAYFLYPHLLQLLGLFALAFGAWVARVGEGEVAEHGWIRSGLVTLVLLVAGSWSLASKLPLDAARPVAFGLTLFFLSLGIFVWMTPGRVQPGPPLAQVQSRLPAPLLLFTLGFVLLTLVPISGVPVWPSSGISRLLLGAAISALPMPILWAMSVSHHQIRQRISDLAFLEHPTPAAHPQQGTKLLGLVACLCLLIVFAAIGAQLEGTSHVPSILAAGLSLGWGIVAGALASAVVEKTTLPFQEKIRELMRPSVEPDGALDLEVASKICEQSIANRTWVFVAIVLGPALASAAIRLTIDSPNTTWCVWGIALGLAFFGAGHAWLLNHAPNNSERTFGMMSLMTCLTQVLLICMVISST